MVNSVRAISTQKAKVEDAEIKEIYDNFVSAMDEDFNTPVAISEILKLLKIAKMAVKDENYAKISQINTVICDLLEKVLGLTFSQEQKTSNANEEKLLQIIANIRNDLRAEKNYALSDKVRDEVNALGIKQADGKIG